MLTADPLTDGATGLVFPGSPGHWLRVGYRELEPKDTQGVTYTYQMEGEGQGVLTCYVYTLGLMAYRTALIPIMQGWKCGMSAKGWCRLGARRRAR